jgi:hypothetical protein
MTSNFHQSLWEGFVSNQSLKMAFQLIQSGRVEQARRLLEQSIKEDLHNIHAWKLYAHTYFNPEDKIRIWESCLKHNPANPLAQQNLACLTVNREQKQNVGPSVEPIPPTPAPVKYKITRSSQVLLWASIAGFLVMMGLSVYSVISSIPKDPADYRHTEPMEYYLYVPKSYTADQEWPLFIGFHGPGGAIMDCWDLWQPYAEREGFILLCPTFWHIGEGRYQRNAESLVWDVIGQVKKEYNVEQRMFIVGFFAGAHFVQEFAYNNPQFVSGVSILSAGSYDKVNLDGKHILFLVVIDDQASPYSLEQSSLFSQYLALEGFNVQYEVLPGIGQEVTNPCIRWTVNLFRKTKANDK